MVEALDADAGVGFGALSAGSADASSLLDNLTFPKDADGRAAWGRRESLLLRKLSEALANSALEITPWSRPRRRSRARSGPASAATR